MNPDTDPMLGDEKTQADYLKAISTAMEEEADKTREARRTPEQTNPARTVLIGADGFGNGIKAIP